MAHLTPDTSKVGIEKLARYLEHGGDRQSAAQVRALLAERDALRTALEMAGKATQLIVDLIDERKDEDDCNACRDCGALVMCRFHSVMSALQGRTWTARAVERDHASRQAKSAALDAGSPPAETRREITPRVDGR